MLKNILNLDGVHVLNRNQQKKVFGGRLTVRNLAATHNVLTYNGGNVACECSWDYNEDDGTGWHSRTGPCPTSLEYSCI